MNLPRYRIFKMLIIGELVNIYFHLPSKCFYSDFFFLQFGTRIYIFFKSGIIIMVTRW